jgi:hypothetical protein
VARRPGGKAASRKARQRYVPRAAERPTTPAAQPVEMPDAHERRSPDAAPPRQATPVTSTAVGSTLSVRERAEYHYVERDLRNIGILTALMAVLLLVAWAAFTALGLVG